MPETNLAGRDSTNLTMTKWIYWVVVSNILYFHPYLGKDFQFDAYFSDGLKPPTRSTVFLLSVSRSPRATNFVGFLLMRSESGWKNCATLCLKGGMVEWYGGNSSGLNFQIQRFWVTYHQIHAEFSSFFFQWKPSLNSVLFPLQEILRLTASLETCSNAGEGGVVCPSCFFCWLYDAWGPSWVC